MIFSGYGSSDMVATAYMLLTTFGVSDLIGRMSLI